MIVDPGREKARTNQSPQWVTYLDSVAGFDRRINVEGSGDVPLAVDEDQVIVGGGVGFRRGVYRFRVEYLAGDGRTRDFCLGVGIQIDRTAAVVSDVRRVVQ
jgi:hypothetical protein